MMAMTPVPLGASQTALYALYSHYEDTYEAWRQAGLETPPVFMMPMYWAEEDGALRHRAVQPSALLLDSLNDVAIYGDER